MSLIEQKFLFLDCQTTGMRPTSGSLIELGWGLSSAAELGQVESRLVQLPEGEWVPSRVQEITGIKHDMLSGGVNQEALVELLEKPAENNVPVLVHYAQFEKAFLEDLFTRHGKTQPFNFLCTYRIAQKLFPNVPSRNIRALVGFLGFPFRDIKRAETHVRATMEVWSALALELETHGIRDVESLSTWLGEKPKAKGKKDPAAKPAKYEYRVDRLKRLELPARPGVYRMLSKSGDILYVGKATSLKDRVNSYFRGKKGRDPKKLELMAQVWDLQVTVCGSPLEAALLENDEIKRLDPPYNVSLKAGRRQLHFYSRNFEHSNYEQTPEYPVGPFRGFNAIEQLRQLTREVSTERFKGVFYEAIDQNLMEEGYRIFAERRLGGAPLPSIRQLIALGLASFRKMRKLADEEAEEEEIEELLEEEDAEEREETPEDVADRLDRLLLRAALNYLKAKAVTRLLNAEVHWKDGEEERVLRFRNGRIGGGEPVRRESPWQELDIQDYDRMSVLLSEVQKGGFRVQLGNVS